MTTPHLSTSIQQPHRGTSGAPAADPDVGEILRRIDVARTLSGKELEVHIRDCETLWRRAYGRFQDLGNPADRDEALLWLHRMNEAILMRSPEVLAARHAAFERQVAEGCGYFIDQGERDRARLGGSR